MTNPTTTTPTTTPRARTDGMISTRRRDSASKRQHVRDTLQRMLDDGTPITFASVARQAGVSTWLVYAPGVREAIEQARTQHRDTAPPRTTDDPGLATDLALARAEITRLRTERDQQQHQLRRALGARLDNLAKADLLARLDELTRHNTELAATATQQQTDNHALQIRVTELEEDLAAARTSLRRMIRTENRSPDHVSGQDHTR
jgi:hypothetical protein